MNEKITTEGIENYIEYLENRLSELSKTEDVQRWGSLVEQKLDLALSLEEDSDEKFEELDRETREMKTFPSVKLYLHIADMVLNARSVMMSMEDARAGLI